MYAAGGILRAPVASANSIPRSSPVLANPVPMARQMMRYRTQGGPMARLQSPTQSPKFNVDMGKFGSKKFPMPKSEMGPITNPAYN